LQAVGLVKGKVVARQTLRTTGEPNKIRLVADRRTIRASRDDLAYVTVEITDKHGQLVPNAEVPITFSISGAGELAAVGSGRANRPESFHGRSRTTDHGRALAILRPVGPAGAIQLRASAPGLSSSEITIKTAD
jgi:beta-galactosidase